MAKQQNKAQFSFNRQQLFALIDGLESVHIDNCTPEQLEAHDSLIPILEEGLDHIDSQDNAQAIAELIFS